MGPRMSVDIYRPNTRSKLESPENFRTQWIEAKWTELTRVLSLTPLRWLKDSSVTKGKVAHYTAIRHPCHIACSKTLNLAANVTHYSVTLLRWLPHVYYTEVVPRNDMSVLLWVCHIWLPYKAIVRLRTWQSGKAEAEKDDSCFKVFMDTVSWIF